MVSANDLITLYVGLELQSLALYVVAAFQRDIGALDRGRAEIFRPGRARLGHAALRRLAGLRLLRGTGLRADLARRCWPARRAAIGPIIGLVFIIAGLAFKISAVPFHMWTPDVYEGAPTPVTAFFAVAPKIAAIALFVRVMIGPFGRCRAMAPDHRLLCRSRRWCSAPSPRSPAQHQAADGLQLDRPCRLRADRPRRRQREGHPRRARLSGDLPVHESRHLGRHPADAAPRRMVEEHLRSRRARRAPSRCWRWRC